VIRDGDDEHSMGNLVEVDRCRFRSHWLEPATRLVEAAAAEESTVPGAPVVLEHVVETVVARLVVVLASQVALHP